VNAPLPSRIAHVTGGIAVQLSATEQEQLTQYCELLRQWNKTINLTGLPLEDFPNTTLQKLLAEPLAILPLIENREMVWLDLGSGGGSPAIPLAITRPAVHLTMVEARERKSAFLREVVRSLGLKNARVLTARFEELSEERGTAELLTVRAVKPDRPFFEVASSLLTASGKLAVFGKSPAPEGLPLKLISSTAVHATNSAVHWFAKP